MDIEGWTRYRGVNGVEERYNNLFLILDCDRGHIRP